MCACVYVCVSACMCACVCMRVYLCVHMQAEVQCLPHLSSSLFLEAGSVAEPRPLKFQLSLATQLTMGIPCLCLLSAGVTDGHRSCLAFMCGMNVASPTCQQALYSLSQLPSLTLNTLKI